MTAGALLKLGHMRPPVRRVLAIDAGSRWLKLLLAESDFGRLRILKEELLDLQAEGLLSADEIKTHLHSRLVALGNPPLALVLPQNLSISQVIDLPQVPESEVAKLIAEETIKLGGVSESRIIYDFVRTEAPAKDRQQFWVTLCQEGDIRERILRLGVDREDLCEVTTAANALIAAYRAASPLSSRAILVHLGAQSTVIVLLLAGQGAFAASFQMGGDSFTRSLARLQKCSEETAESHKRAHNLFSGPDESPQFAEAIDAWVAELKRQLNEWFEHNPALGSDPSRFELVASGGGFDQPGLLDYLNTKAELDLRPWPKDAQPSVVGPSKHFEIAFGTALQALGHSPQPVSLLPNDYRIAWKKRLGRQKLELASFVLLIVCGLVLAFATWHQASLVSRKQALLGKTLAGQDAVQENDELTGDLLGVYENLRPIFLRQQNSLDILRTLALLQQSRSNRTFWYVLVADQQSYFSPTPMFTTTNRPARTNLLATILDHARTGSGEALSMSSLTNVSPAKPGLIAELCIPEGPEAARRVLSHVVNDLKQQRLFSRVDLLSDDLRRNLADPKVVIPDRAFVLALDFAETEFQQPSFVKKAPIAQPARLAPKRLGRPARLVPDAEQNSGQSPP